MKQMACNTKNAKILIRRDISTTWTALNPILGDGEQGYEKNTGKMKIGDGIHSWNSLPYFSAGGGGGLPGATGATGPQGPATAAFFDGGYPSISYASGPVFDMGGVT